MKNYTLFLLQILILFSFALAQNKTEDEKFRDSEEYSNIITKVRERKFSLSNPSVDEAYRIIIVPTFYNPIILNLEKNANGFPLISKKLKGMGGYDVGRIKKQKKVLLEEKQWQNFNELLSKANFENVISVKPLEEIKADGTILSCDDGTTILIERLRGDKYEAVLRRCEIEDAIEAIGKYSVEISKLKVDLTKVF